MTMQPRAVFGRRLLEVCVLQTRWILLRCVGFVMVACAPTTAPMDASSTTDGHNTHDVTTFDTSTSRDSELDVIDAATDDGTAPSDTNQDVALSDAADTSDGCVDLTCEQMGTNCGMVSTRCRRFVNCGTCGVAGEVCGGGGTPNVCAPLRCPMGTTCLLQCAPFDSTANLGGASLDSNFWVGYRFEITGRAFQLQRLGMSLRLLLGQAGTAFGAIVQLSGPNDFPDSNNLTTSDVLATTTLNVAAGFNVQTVSAPLSLTLQPGWYAVVFGTGARGTSLGMSSITYNRVGARNCDNGQIPFSLLQSNGTQVYQAGSPNLFVQGM